MVTKRKNAPSAPSQAASGPSGKKLAAGPPPSKWAPAALGLLVVAAMVFYFARQAVPGTDGVAEREEEAPSVALPTLTSAQLWTAASASTPAKRSVRCIRRKDDKEANHCMPPEGCSRHVIDGLVTAEEVQTLRGLIEWLVHEAWGGGDGPPSVVDLHQGSISYKDKFVLLHKLMEFKGINFTEPQVTIYNAVRDRLGDKVRELFGAPDLLPEMSFFSHINASKAARNTHDEYWHPHIDTEQYGTFAVTTILYLNDFGADYRGGAFRFADDIAAAKQALGGPENEGNWSAVEPVSGRIIAFTSGRENVHRVEPVSAGVRLALTMAYTCSRGKAASILRWEGGGGSGLLEAMQE